jgi:hypothetical protein
MIDENDCEAIGGMKIYVKLTIELKSSAEVKSGGALPPHSIHLYAVVLN